MARALKHEGRLWLLAGLVLALACRQAAAAISLTATCTDPALVASTWQVNCMAVVTATVATDTLDVRVDDVSVQNSCNDTSVSVSASVTCALTHNLTAPYTDPTSWVFTATDSTESVSATPITVTKKLGVLGATVAYVGAASESAAVALDVLTYTVNITNNGPVALAGVTVAVNQSSNIVTACPTTATIVPVNSSLACNVSYTVQQTDLERLSSLGFLFTIAATNVEAANLVGGTISKGVTLRRVAELTPAITNCTLLAVPPAGAAVANVSCTGTITNSGTLQLTTVKFATLGTACDWSTGGFVTAGQAKTCTFSTAVPWVNFTSLQNLAISSSASAALNAGAVGVTLVSPVVASTNFTLRPVAAVNISDVTLANPSGPVTTSGTTANGTFTLGNVGTLNLTHLIVTAQQPGGAVDPRISAIVIACQATAGSADVSSNGTHVTGSVAAGAAVVSCVEQLLFSNVSFLEPGNLVFNLTAVADNAATVVRQVTVPVNNTPSLVLSVFANNCTVPAGVAQAPARLTCPPDTIQLNNTGHTRIAVDDVVVQALPDLGAITPNCTLTSAVQSLNAVFQNLTAVNVTLFPGDVLKCGLSVPTTQAVFEQGSVLLQVAATGVASYNSLNISGVANNVMALNSTRNITQTPMLNLTTSTSSIRSVAYSGDTVTYTVVVSNRGNVILRNVSVFSNVAPSLSGNFSAIDDGLDVGEAVTLASNITFNNTMIRASNGSARLWANATANATAAGGRAVFGAGAGINVTTFTCADNRTAIPAANSGKCFNDTHCGRPLEQFCDNTTSPEPWYTCWGGAIDVEIKLGTCRNTACKNCSLCLAAFSSFAKTYKDTTDANVVADALGSTCLGTQRTAALCGAAVNATRASYQGNAGKRAALICRALQECPTTRFNEAVCNTTILGTAGQVPAGTLDFCTPEGTNASTVGVGGVVAASTPLPALTSRYMNSTDCNSTTLMYSNVTVGRRVTCNAADGNDTVTTLYACQPTPCRACQTCYADMAAFTPTVQSLDVATDVSTAFTTACAAKPGRTAAQCNAVALAIEASHRGNLGKRPFALCAALRECDAGMADRATCVIRPNKTETEANVTVATADSCTIDATAWGRQVALVDNSTATMPNITAQGKCLASSDCASGQECSFVTPAFWCQCTSGVDNCTRLGVCVGATCDTCAACVVAVDGFVQQQQRVVAAADVAANWAAAFSAIRAQVPAAITINSAAVQSAIAGSIGGNIGKRAGSLCNQMTACTASQIGTCSTLNATVGTYHNISVTGRALDLCTVEGVTASAETSRPPNVFATAAELPINTCRVDNNRCDHDHECDLGTLTGSACVCDAATGTDTCTKYSGCKPTPCKLCSDCLKAASAVTTTQLYTQDVAALKAALSTACAAAGGSAMACALLVTRIDNLQTSTGTDAALRFGKRAGSICGAGGLGFCNATLPRDDSCTLQSYLVTGTTGTAATLTNDTSGVVDLCTAEGLVAGRDLPGTQRTGLPPGMCDTAADCADSANALCDKTSTVFFCTCTASAGTDTCRGIGVCRPTPAKACSDCLQAFSAFVTTAQSSSNPDRLADSFSAACTTNPTKNYTAAACDLAAAAIANSYAGNVGKRAGALCKALGECKPVNLTGLILASGNNVNGSFSNCTKEGVATGTTVTGFSTSITVAAGGCRVDSNCTTGTEYCRKAPGNYTCSCSEASGLDSCEYIGTCTATPCSKCQTCLAGMQAAVLASLPSGVSSVTDANVASRLSASQSCTGLTAQCSALVSSYTTTTATVVTNYFGLRPGAVCTALQQCATLPSTCVLKSAKLDGSTNVTGTLDMCDAEGVVGGTQLYKVVAAGAAPTGRCLVDADCKDATKQCDTKNTTDFYTCSATSGLDAKTTYGACVAKPAPPPAVTDCQRCANCITAVRGGVEAAALNASRSAAELGDAFYTLCSRNYTLEACRNVTAAIRASYAGNLGRRAGAICARLGECGAAAVSCPLQSNKTAAVVADTATTTAAAVVSVPAANVSASANATNSTTNSTANATAPSPSPTPAATSNVLAGLLDLCTIEGVTTGSYVLNTFNIAARPPNNSCVLDADCATGFFCSDAATKTVCRCVNGLDSCDTLSTCRAVPTAAPPAAADTRTPCQKCGDCLAAVQPWVSASAVTSNDSFAIAGDFVRNCTAAMTANDFVRCKAIGAAIAFSTRGNLAKRAGALCSRLGNCTFEATAPSCNMTSRGSLDLCTQEGVQGGALITAAPGALPNGTCTTDAQCNATSPVCLFANPPTTRCTCDGGVDTCVLTGTCTNFCATKEGYIRDYNAKVPSCDSPFDQCGPGLTCTANTQCKKLACDATSTTGIVVQSCFGLCTPAVRNIVGAKMADDGRTLLVSLNTPAADASFPCVAAFGVGTATTAKIGSDAQCSVSDTTLVVALGRTATFMPGTDTLSLAPTQRVLYDLLSAGSRFTGTDVAVARCNPSTCAAPKPALVGPKTVPEPCDPSTASDIIFDASASYDGSGRPLTKYAWSQGGSDVVLAAAIDSANAANGGAGSVRLTIPGASLVSLANGAYTLTVTVTNFLNTAASADFIFTKVASGQAPVVSISGGTVQAFAIAEGVKVSAQLLPTSVCAGKKVEYEWKSMDSPAWAAVPAGYARKDLVIPGPVGGVRDGNTTIVQLTAKFVGGSSSAALNVTLVARGSPLQARLRGPSGDVRNDRAIVLNASSSVDPDDPANAAPFAYSWTCVRADFPTPCFTGTTQGAQSGGAWVLDTGVIGQLAAGVAHTFTVTASKGGRADSQSLTLTPAVTAIPTGRIVRVCAGACPPSHNADTPLALTLVPDAGAEAATVAWSSDQLDAATLAKASGRDFPVAASSASGGLPASGAVTVTATLTADGKSSTTSITVPINGKPSCAGASCLAVTAVSDTFPGASFKAQATGFADDAPGLRYDFGTVDATGRRSVLASGPATTFTYTGLPVGDTKVYVCAVDAAGASACQDSTVKVKPAASDFKVADALTSFDVGQLSGAGDVSVMAAGAQALQSLSSYASTTAAASQSDAEKAQVQTAIAAKTGAMLSSLARNVNDYIDDPQTMGQLVSAVATLSKTTSQLSSDSKAKMLNVASSGIAAAKLSPKPITPDSASRLLAVVAAGASVPSTCKLPAGCKAATAVARQLLEQEQPDAWQPEAQAELAVAVIEPRVPTGLALPTALATPMVAPLPHARRLAGANDTANSANDTANATSPSPSPSPAPAAAVTPVFNPNYAARADAIAELLLQAATPATRYLSGGDSGLYAAVANALGRVYPTLSPALVAGEVLDAAGALADAAAGANVALKFSGALLGSCLDADGAAVTGSSGCAVPVALTYVSDAAPALAADFAVAPLPDQFTPVSGAVGLKVAGSASAALPCETAGCTATLTVPITEYADPSKLYKCAHIVDGKLYLDDAVTGTGVVTNTTGGTPAPQVACSVARSGAYLVGSYPNPAWHQGGVAETPNLYSNLTGLVLGAPVYVRFRFEITGTFADFTSNAAKFEAFKADVVTQLASSLGVAAGRITITRVYEGSVQVELTIDTTDLSAAQLQLVVGAITYQAASLFTPQFMATYGITGVSAAIVGPPETGPNIPAIVGGVVGGVGGAAVLVGTTWFVLKRRRAAGVEPRANRGLLAEDGDAAA